MSCETFLLGSAVGPYVIREVLRLREAICGQNVHRDSEALAIFEQIAIRSVSQCNADVEHVKRSLDKLR